MADQDARVKDSLTPEQWSKITEQILASSSGIAASAKATNETKAAPQSNCKSA
jgi:hypothetical protein